MRKSNRLVVFSILIALLVLTACGGQNGASSI